MTATETTRCVLDSLAVAYARTVHHAADLAGLPVLAGPVEATALGNVLVQARTHDAAPPSLEAIRERLAASTPLRRYEPS